MSYMLPPPSQQPSYYPIVRGDGAPLQRPASAIEASSAPYLGEPTLPILRESLDPQRVLYVHASVLEEIEAADRRQNGDRPYGRVEVGGWLLANRFRPDEIAAATDSSRANTASTCELLPRAEIDTGYFGFRGCWHSHDDGSPPSATDLDAFATGRVSTGLDYWIALIASPAEYAGWRLAGYATRWIAGDWRNGAECVPVRVQTI